MFSVQNAEDSASICITEKQTSEEIHPIYFSPREHKHADRGEQELGWL
jgi:hypothetical protein